MPGQSERHNIFFPLTVLLSGLFTVTIMAVTAASFGDPAAPINDFLNDQVGTILTCEAAGILVTGFLAMTLDRRRTLREPGDSENPIEHFDVSTEEEPLS